jgi:hypothetical protein
MAPVVRHNDNEQNELQNKLQNICCVAQNLLLNCIGHCLHYVGEHIDVDKNHGKHTWAQDRNTDCSNEVEELVVCEIVHIPLHIF